MGFEDRFERIKNNVDCYPLTILVWGAGPGGQEHYEKRKKIKKELQARFLKSDVCFSEDFKERDIEEIFPGFSGLTVPEQELFHLKACDVCVVVDSSQGSNEEIAHFVNTNLSYKLLILTNKKYEFSTSFPAEIRKNENQIFYTDDEYKKCSMVEKIITHVTQVALYKLTRLYD
jgi:hypothetical protein